MCRWTNVATKDSFFPKMKQNLLLKNVLLEKVTLQRHFLENLTFVMSNDRVSRICLWNRETDVAMTYSQESVVTTTLSSMTHFLGAVSASLLEINSHL